MYDFLRVFLIGDKQFLMFFYYIITHCNFVGSAMN